jgi:hypothetical protein
VDLRTVDACRVQHGKVVEHVVGYRDMAAALKAVGLEEQGVVLGPGASGRSRA